MTTLQERVENKELLAKLIPVEEAVKYVTNGTTLAISGFTKSGEPKLFMPALAQHLAANDPNARISLFTGASLSEEVEGPIAPFVARRAPYMSSAASRKLINSGKMDFADQHLSAFARNLMYGMYGDIDVAVIEVSRIRKDGSVVLSSSVGVSAEALVKAKKVILEVNTATPDFTGFHDIAIPPVHPHTSWPLPIVNVRDRVGTPYVEFDTSKVVGIIHSEVPDHPVGFKAVSKTDTKLAENVIAWLLECQRFFDWGKRLPPLQSGVGNVANAIIGELYKSPFEKVRFWTEVFQDGMMKFVEDDKKFEAASATAISFSAEARKEFEQQFERCRERIILRPMWLSNSPELVTRLFVVAMNTPIEVDIYGHANSTHVDGSRLINGLGGSGDFLRNAYLSAVHTPSVRRLKDGRTVSCVMPYVRHIDHTEHDLKCIITEQGYAFMHDIQSAWHRAQMIIEKCAHPHFRPLLHDYMKLAKGGVAPRPTDLKVLEGWWTAYDEACRNFPAGEEVDE